MTREELKNKIISFGIEISFPEEENTPFLTLSVNPSHLHQLAKQVKEDADTSFDYMFCQTGIDWEENLEVVYHLRSTSKGHEVVIRTKITDRENPTVDSVYDLWKTADFHEREIFDLLGIRFNNHPDLRRIFLDDNWEGFPLRKDYVDEINIVEL
ncbi:MAG: NADH-quinone oxidoreductase subunit C [Flavobacterium sp.]|nr:NADH-quinone oxidoreductase subunit C [Flavobacterium sp.]